MANLVRLEGTTPVSLALPADLPYAEWRDALLGFARLGKASQWWIGDCLFYGENAYGEEMAQAASETGYSSESLRGMLWVSSRIPPSVRRPTLSWSHHQVVAGSDDPKTWLDTAEAEGWTVKMLKEAVKGPPKQKAICGMENCPMRDT